MTASVTWAGEGLGTSAIGGSHGGGLKSPQSPAEGSPGLVRNEPSCRPVHLRSHDHRSPRAPSGGPHPPTPRYGQMSRGSCARRRIGGSELILLFPGWRVPGFKGPETRSTRSRPFWRRRGGGCHSAHRCAVVTRRAGMASGSTGGCSRTRSRTWWWIPRASKSIGGRAGRRPIGSTRVSCWRCSCGGTGENGTSGAWYTCPRRKPKRTGR